MGSQIQLNDFVGEHGSYQLSITVFLFVRYVLLGLMANSGPLMTPDVTFYCRLPRDEIIAIMPNITILNATEQELEIKEEFKRICQLDLHLYQEAYLNEIKHSNITKVRRIFNATNRIRECSDFDYQLAPDQGHTMTSEFDLVCDRDWLRSFFQSLISASIVVAHVFWGTFSDKYGRFNAQKLCLTISLVAGLLSILARDFWTFTLMRALCSFGDLGLVVSLTTTVVELVGSRYRGLSVAIVNFGYALGVAILPYIVAYFEDFRYVITFTVLCHVLTIPCIFTTNESIRWLITNRKFHSAKKELKRIVAWNRKSTICYKLWPLNLISNEPRSTKDEMAALKEKQAFEVLFRRFMEQVESQDLYDPMNESLGDQSIMDDSRLSSEDGSFKGKSSNETQPTERFINIVSSTSVGENLNSESFPLSVHQLDIRKACSCDQIERISRGLSISHLSGLKENLEPGSRATNEVTVRRPNQQADCINLVAHQLSFVGRVTRLFKDKQLMITFFAIVWTTFNSELQYSSFIIINLEVGEDVYLNYILGGCMEALAAITASLMLSYVSRRQSLITFWLLISLSCFGLSVAHIDSTWAVWLLALAKFSQSSLSSIASVAAYESFPTFLRQSGSGLVFTLGMLGSVFAPIIFAEFDDHAGMDRVLMTFSLSSLTAASLIYFFLTETRDCELQ